MLPDPSIVGDMGADLGDGNAGRTGHSVTLTFTWSQAAGASFKQKSLLLGPVFWKAHHKSGGQKGLGGWRVRLKEGQTGPKCA